MLGRREWPGSKEGRGPKTDKTSAAKSFLQVSYLAGRSPYISLKIKKRHYEHEHYMIEAQKYLITWFSDDIFENSG